MQDAWASQIESLPAAGAQGCMHPTGISALRGEAKCGKLGKLGKSPGPPSASTTTLHTCHGDIYVTWTLLESCHVNPIGRVAYIEAIEPSDSGPAKALLAWSWSDLQAKI